MLLLTSSICDLFFNNFHEKKMQLLLRMVGLIHQNQVSAFLGVGR